MRAVRIPLELLLPEQAGLGDDAGHAALWGDDRRLQTREGSFNAFSRTYGRDTLRVRLAFRPDVAIREVSVSGADSASCDIALAGISGFAA